MAHPTRCASPSLITDAAAGLRVGDHRRGFQQVELTRNTPRSLGERALVYIVSKYAEQARVRGLSPYDLRHRFGYRMAQTVPLHRLAQRMGHDSLDTRLRYVRGTQQNLQQAVETIAWA